MAENAGSENAVASAIRMSRVWAMPSADTFDIEPIYNFVWKYLSQSKVSIDPFARNRRWATYTNDLHPATDAEFHLEAADFLEELMSSGVRADLCIFDPPYSLRQCKEVYDGIGIQMTADDSQQLGGWYRHKEILNRLLTDNAVVLSFGWNTVGMGKKYGFAIEEIMLVSHGRAHNDTICMAERRVQQGLFSAPPTQPVTEEEEPTQP